MAKEHILHVFDDEKFIDGAIGLFDSDTIFCHKYVVVSTNINELKYVTSKKVITVKYDRVSYVETIKGILESDNIKVVAVHALNQAKWEFINSLDKSYTFVWFIFGYDLYNNWKPFYQNLFEKQTKAYENRLKSKKLLFVEKIIRYPFVYKLLANISYKRLEGVNSGLFSVLRENHPKQFYQAVKKIDFVAPILRSEMELVKKVNPRLSYLPFTYNSLENFSRGIDAKVNEDSSNILVGNSASSTNNHVEVFIKLSKVNLGKRKVIVPLSYGDNTYRAFVLEKGRTYLKEHFVPILDFIPLEQYNSLLASCSIAIFNHRRQQALGNVMVMVSKGAKVFINDKSPIYKEFRKEGLNIYRSDEINNNTINDAFSENKSKYNINKIKSLYGHNTVMEKLSKLTLTLSKFIADD